MSIYKAGTWPGKVLDYGIGETKAGKPKVFVVFDVQFEAGQTEMTWEGYLESEASQEISFNALQALGFKGKVTDLIDGPDSEAIALGTEAKLVVEEKPYTTTAGEEKTFFKIKWVNGTGSSMKVQRADAATAKAKLLKLNVDGALAKFRTLNPAPAALPTPPQHNDDDIPF